MNALAACALLAAAPVVLWAPEADAIMAKPTASNVRLFDGSDLRVRAVGDQHGHLTFLEDDQSTLVVPVRVDAHGKPAPADSDVILWDYHVAELNDAGYLVDTGARRHLCRNPLWCEG